jgi:predicted kinase
VVLVGAAGAGKSTFAAKHFEASAILSSDAYRALIAGDETDQRATMAAFGRLHRELARRLGQGRLTVVDATNVERPARRALLLRSTAAGLPAVAIVFDLPMDVVISRNNGRIGRVVPESVVRHHLRRLRSSLDPPAPGLAAEGFLQVMTIRSADDLDAVSVTFTRP